MKVCSVCCALLPNLLGAARADVPFRCRVCCGLIPDREERMEPRVYLDMGRKPGRPKKQAILAT